MEACRQHCKKWQPVTQWGAKTNFVMLVIITSDVHKLQETMQPKRKKKKKIKEENKTKEARSLKAC